MIIDAETIQTSQTHACIRKIDMVSWNGHFQFYDVAPCVPFSDLEAKWRKVFNWCQKRIHGIKHYFPRAPFVHCNNIDSLVKHFIVTGDIDIVLFKGGIWEKQICINIRTRYLDLTNICKVLHIPKPESHDPRTENMHYIFHLQKHNVVRYRATSPIPRSNNYILRKTK